MLAHVVDEAAERFGDAAAFVAAEGWEMSYAELARLSHEMGAILVRRGIGEGDVVAIVLPSIPEYVVTYAAVVRAGAIAAGVNARLTADERARVLELARPSLVVATRELMPDDRVVPAAPRAEVVPSRRVDDVLASMREPGASVVALPDDPDRPVAIIFTSGTTGAPKGAVFAGRQLAFITQIDTGWRWGDGGHALAGTSFAHLGPMTKLAGTLVRGTTTHLMERWRAADALALIAEHRMAGVGGIPTQIALMLREPGFDQIDLGCVQAIVVGGGPASPALVREARARFDAALAVRYSCTEAGIGVGTAFDAPGEDAEISVGRPHPGVELTIVDDDGRPAADGVVGEVCLRSPAVMSAYWRDAEATRAAFTVDGAVRTGDLGWIDEAGRLRLAGRSREMYVRGGYNVYPTEVEAVLADHPSVADVAVVPRDDPVMGEVGVAVVVARDESSMPTLDDLRAFASARLAHHKLPEDLVAVDALPLTAMDKVDRAALRRAITARPTG